MTSRSDGSAVAGRDPPASALFLARAAAVLADEVVAGPRLDRQGSGIGGRVRGHDPVRVADRGRGQARREHDQRADRPDRLGRYDGQPASMVLAESKRGGGQLAEAADLYKKAAGEAARQAARSSRPRSSSRPSPSPTCALADPSKAAEAVALLDAFVKAYPERPPHRPRRSKTWRGSSSRRATTPRVEKTIAAMAKLPQAPTARPCSAAKSSAKQGDYAKAIAELDQLIKSSPDGSVRQREAQLAKAESLAP